MALAVTEAQEKLTYLRTQVLRESGITCKYNLIFSQKNKSSDPSVLRLAAHPK